MRKAKLNRLRDLAKEYNRWSRFWWQEGELVMVGRSRKNAAECRRQAAKLRAGRA